MSVETTTILPTSYIIELSINIPVGSTDFNFSIPLVLATGLAIDWNVGPSGPSGPSGPNAINTSLTNHTYDATGFYNIYVTCNTLDSFGGTWINPSYLTEAKFNIFPQNTSFAFYNCVNLIKLDCANTSRTTNMNNMFYNSIIFNYDISEWDRKSVV